MRSASILALVSAGFFTVDAGCRGCPEKNRVCPDPNLDACGPCKFGFEQVPLDVDGVMPCYQIEEVCNDVTTCNNNGRCSAFDNSCQCFPDYFGLTCSEKINTGGISNSGLVGVVVGWLLGFCLLVFLAKKLYKMYEEDKLDDLKCPCCRDDGGRAANRGRFARANNREPARRNSRDAGAVEFVNANQANQSPPASNRQPQAQRNYGRLAINREEPAAAARGTQNASAGAQQKPAAPTLEMKMTMVKQIKEIIPDTNNEKALTALQTHQWNLANAIQFLMEESLANQA